MRYCFPPISREREQTLYNNNNLVLMHIGQPRGVLSTSLYGGGPCQQFISEPQILSHNFEEPQILSFKSLRPKILLHKMSLNVTTLAIMSFFYNL